MRYEKAILTGDIHFDGNEFVDCTFKNDAVLHYSGGPFVLAGKNAFGTFRWEFHGSAAATIEILRLIYGSPTGPAIVQELLSTSRPAGAPVS